MHEGISLSEKCRDPGVGSGFVQRRRELIARQQAAAARLAATPVGAGALSGNSVGSSSTLGLTLDSMDNE